MNRRALLQLAAATSLVSCSGLSPTATRSTQLAGAFDANLYRALAANPGNLFVSPFSVACAFALLYPGAKGQTAAELASTFDFDPSPTTVAARIRELRQTMTEHAGGSEFSTANAAWVERTMGLREDYARMIKDEFAAAVEAVDFIADQPAALQRINAWCARETHDRIPKKKLNGENPARRLVITNAVYFKGKWSSPFSASATQDGEFFAASGGPEKARLMRHETYARYFDGGGFQAAEFSYDAGEFALAVFLPRQRAGLGAFEHGLTSAKLDGWLQRLSDSEYARLDVTLPKVKLEADYELTKQLDSLGLRAVLSPEADLSGVTEQLRLAVSAVIHKTFLAIDEEGTEAAAVTALDVVVTSGRAGPPEPPPIEFKADHPFFIVLRHQRSGVLLFLGRIATLS